MPVIPDTQAEEQYQMARLRMPTRSNMQRLYGFTVVAGVFLGFFAGVALDAVTGHAPYYITRQTLMGYLAGLIAPTMTLAVIKAGQLLRRDATGGRLREVWRSVYAVAGFLTGIACMAIYSQLPSPPFQVGLSIIVYPIATTLAFPIVASLSDSYETAYRRERRTREIFSRYVSGEIVERLLAQAEPVTLSGERRPLTVLFSDIRGFSKMSQEMAPDDVVRTLNEYFTLMVDIVFRFGGTVDKFMGDGLMVLFGAPLAMDDQAYIAVRTAQAMQSAVAEFNVQHARAGRTSLHIGIGLTAERRSPATSDHPSDWSTQPSARRSTTPSFCPMSRDRQRPSSPQPPSRCWAGAFRRSRGLASLYAALSRRPSFTGSRLSGLPASRTTTLPTVRILPVTSNPTPG
ncbi:MAG: adenylate/guanylate cyclase domain-containing protein [Chloroflexota bacterium]|nr:adenylate/guanylate cyclase domain-containing protein [Chloroflexota bacterium]